MRKPVRQYRFTYWKNSRGQWFWHFVAPNNEIITHSEGYTTKKECMEGVKIMQLYAASAPIKKDEAYMTDKQRKELHTSLNSLVK